MNNTEPTQEQLKKFWEWCGWKYITGTYLHYSPEQVKEGVDKGTHNVLEAYSDFPLLTPDNLFEYAVPIAVNKLAELYGIKTSWSHSLEVNKQHAIEQLLRLWLSKIKTGLSYELALFWAIWEVIK